MTSSKVFTKVNRTPADVVAQAREVTVADVHESMGPTGRAQLMSARMRPLGLAQKIAGPAVTS